MLDPETFELARTAIGRLTVAHKTVVTAESCTAGLVAVALTSVPGSSAAVHGGFVTYANAAKTAMIGVPAELIERHGAVSEPVARAMAEGARTRSGADVAVAVTGVAGPGGGTPDKPVGLVHLASATARGTTHRVVRLGDLGRERIRAETVRVALEMVLEAV